MSLVNNLSIRQKVQRRGAGALLVDDSKNDWHYRFCLDHEACVKAAVSLFTPRV